MTVLAVLVLAVSQPALAQGGSPPAAPARPAVDSVSHDAVTISWSDPADSSITGYQILRRIPAIHDPGHYEVIEDDTGGSDTSYEDTDVEPETKYAYRVKARNAHGLSNRSGYVSTTTPAAPVLTPTTPARPTVDSLAYDAVSITWSDPGDASITGYQVLRRNPEIHAPGQFEVIEDDTSSSDTSYEDTDVDPETKYVYRVKARNAHGLSGRSPYVSTTTPEDPTPPNTAPTGLPTITGTAQVGETLSADTSGISDGNGLTGVQYTYQWVRGDGTTDTDISGATAQTYTLTSDDQGNTVKVSVGFTDDDGYAETLTSAATGTVATLTLVDSPSDPPTSQQQQQAPAGSVSEGSGLDLPADDMTTGWIVVGDSATGTLGTTADVDGFKINLVAGKRYRIDAVGDGPRDFADGGTHPGELEVQVRTLSGTIATTLERLNGFGGKDPAPASTNDVVNLAGGPDGGARSEFDVTATDTYLVKVTTANGSSHTGTYTVRASEITSEQAFGDFTSTWNSGRIKINDTIAMTGTIDNARDTDWYIASLEANKCYEIRVKGDHSNSDHDGGTLRDPKVKVVNFYDYYDKRFYDPHTLAYTGVPATEQTVAYFDMTYIDPTTFELLGNADKICNMVRPADQPNTFKLICNYYCDDDSGQGKNALLKVRVSTGGAGEYAIGVEGEGSTGTYSVFVKEITCPSN